MAQEKWTIKTVSGEILWTLIVEAEPIQPERRPVQPPDPKKTPGNPNPDDRMTEPQRRYLFRLLGAQGIEGKAAEEHLKTYFRVKSLNQVSRPAASQLIDQMVKDQKEASSGTQP